MINYLILAGSLLIVFAIIQLLQYVYIRRVMKDQQYDKGHQMAYWGIVVSATMIVVGLVIIGFSVAAHFQAKKTVATSIPSAPLMRHRRRPPPHARPPPINPYAHKGRPARHKGHYFPKK